MNSDEQVISELKRITRLLTVLATKEMTQREQIQLLDSVGMAPREIAELIGTTANTVSVTLSALRREGRRKKPRTKAAS